MFCLSLGDFFDEVDEGIAFLATPYLRTQHFSLVAAFLRLQRSVASEVVGEFAKKGDDCVEVEDEGSADEGNGVGEELDLQARLGSDVAVADGGGSHDQFVKDDVVLRQWTLLVAQRAHLVGQHHQSQEEILDHGVPEDAECELEDASERVVGGLEQSVDGLAEAVVDVDDLEEEQAGDEGVVVGHECVGEVEGQHHLEHV
jgi:hypothetical protein